MKNLNLILLALALSAGGLYFFKSRGSEPSTFQLTEFATIRWGGRDNTHIVRPNGRVEFVGTLWSKVKRPDRTDERSFYMNVAMNALAHEGFEFAGMTSDEIIMRRPISR
ncbi:MAG: hypothetical protein C5B50_20090 [Verrucomicrobia bacterium]|nr:MAG: hypothetical protein C5B50_20090 [Verrucomicrobiota bacterium]